MSTKRLGDKIHLKDIFLNIFLMSRQVQYATLKKFTF